MTYKMTEQQVLERCLHNDLETLERVFFPMFQDDLTVTTAPKVCGYHTAVVHQQPVTFEAWVATHYDRFRHYPPVAEQLDYIYHHGVDAWKADLIDPVKAAFPKPSAS